MTEPPVQTAEGPSILIVGNGNTVTVFWVLPWQPFASVAVTLYVVVLVGFTVMEAVVAPVLHVYEAPPDAVNVTEPPVQTAEGPSMLMVGNGNTVTVF